MKNGLRAIVVTILLSLIPVLFCPAFADNALESTNESMILLDGPWPEAAVYSRLENTGEVPLLLDNGLIKLTDGEGNPIAEDEYPDVFVNVLLPGEYTYVRSSFALPQAKELAAITGCQVRINGKTKNIEHYTTNRFKCETELRRNVSTQFGENVIHGIIVFRNDTGEELSNFTFVVAFMDEKGNIAYVGAEYFPANISLLPGSSAKTTIEISGNVLQYFTDHSINITSIDAFVVQNIFEW